MARCFVIARAHQMTSRRVWLLLIAMKLLAEASRSCSELTVKLPLLAAQAESARGQLGLARLLHSTRSGAWLKGLAVKLLTAKPLDQIKLQTHVTTICLSDRS